jgi:hypothetical protein
MRKTPLRACLFLLLAVSLPLRLLADESLTKNSQINPNDTYVTFDESTVREAEFPVANSEFASPTDDSAMRTSSAPESKFHGEEGYDTNGVLVLDITFLSSASNSHIREMRFSGGAVELFDGNGARIHSESIEAQLASAIPFLVKSRPALVFKPLINRQQYLGIST